MYQISTACFIYSSLFAVQALRKRRVHVHCAAYHFRMGNISCEFEISTYNTLCSRGPTKVLAESKNARGGHLVFQNEAKNIPWQDFMVMNITCKFEKGSYNIFFSLSVKVSPKSPKMTLVRYFGGLWMTFSEELQGQISACLQRTYICIIYTSHRMI